MRYVFYDLEFASCKVSHKICEFGYVVTDEFYNILEEDNIIINPNIERSDWDYYAVKNILTKSIKEYEAGIKFNSCYERIANLFKNADYVIGHSNACDAQGLNDECIRYNLPPINHMFYDIKEFYKVLNKVNKNIGLERMLQELELIGDLNLHDAQGDAYNTMAVLRALISKYDTTFDMLIKECPKAIDESKDFLVASIERNKQLRIERELKEINLLKKGTANYGAYIKFLDEVKPKCNGSNLLENKKICISYNYECNHFKETTNLIQLITNEGGTYTRKASECDLFVMFKLLQEDKTEIYDGRLLSASISSEKEQRKVEFIEFNNFLKMISITNEQLESLNLPEEIKVVHEGKRYRGKRKRKDKSNVVNTSYPKLNNSLEFIKEYLNA